MSPPGPRGSAGEDAACRFLEARGCRILARNFACRGGELDIVARDGDATVFVEVKQRAGAGRHGAGVEAVGAAKRARIVRAALLYASRHGLSERPLRFDVIAIEGDPEQAPTIRHEVAAFDADGR